MENNLELLPLTDDYIFKRVFAYKGNESVLKDFLEALLKIEIKGIKITNPEIIPYEKGEKRGLLDIKAEINDGTMLDVEMQMKNERNTEERATEYIGKMISEQLQVGEDYQNLKKSIVIFITNYNFLKRNSYHSVGRMKFDKTLKDEYVYGLWKIRWSSIKIYRSALHRITKIQEKRVIKIYKIRSVDVYIHTK